MNNFKKKFSLGMIVVLTSLAVSGAANAAPSNDDAILMSVNGAEYVSETTTPILMSLNGDPDEPSTVVPGDVLTGELTVKNNGPSKGVLKAYLVDVENSGPDTTTMDDWFSGDVQIKANGITGSLVQWDSKNTNGEAQQIGSSGYYGVEILETNLERNASTEIELEVEFPVEAISGNSAGYNAAPNGIPNDYSPGERSSSFDIYLTLQGDTDDGGTTPTTSPTPPTDSRKPTDQTTTPPTQQTDKPENVEKGSPKSIITGAEIFSNPLVIAGLIGVFGVVAGIIILTVNYIKNGKKFNKGNNND